MRTRRWRWSESRQRTRDESRQFHVRQPAVPRPGQIRLEVIAGVRQYTFHRARPELQARLRTPGKAVEQFTGRTRNFTYGMAYIAYSF